jgi:hypothetical protein
MVDGKVEGELKWQTIAVLANQASFVGDRF